METLAQAPTGKAKKAHKAFHGFAYNQAIEHYQELGTGDLEHKRNAALSYWKLHKNVEAEELYAEIVLIDGHTADDIYNYASVLRENKKYDKSDEWMKKFSQMNVSDSRGKMYAAKPGIHAQLLKDKEQFKIKNLDVNSEQSDFGATFYKEQVIFASSREGVKPVRRKWNWNELPFLDVYVADKDASTLDLSNLNRFHKKVNKKYHEGPVAFNQAGDFMIFNNEQLC